MRVEPWYSLPSPPPRPGDPSELRALLEDAVRLRLRSDVDVGTCLSGGLDSSSIVALTARLRGEPAAGRHRSFSVVYPGTSLDESRHIDTVVAATGVDAVKVTPTAAELLRDLPALVRHQDEPFASASLYSQWRVMALARSSGVTVLLDGQGADEVLAGYHYQLGPYLAEVRQRRGWTQAVREALRAANVNQRPRWFMLGLLGYHTLPVPRSVRSAAIAQFSTHQRVPPDLLEPAFAARAGPPSGARHLARGSLAAERRADIQVTSLPALLRYEDRSSMAFSIEARTPFLDYRLVERAMALPAEDLMGCGWTKAILREAMVGLVPDSVRLRRDKLGFATPEQAWLAQLAPQLREWLGPSSRIRPLLKPAGVHAWLSLPGQGLACRPGLWRLVSLELWLRYVEREGVS